MRNKPAKSMETYSIEAITAILVHVPAIQGHPTLQGLWDRFKTLLELLHMIKHPGYPIEGMAGKIIKLEAFALVSNTPWEVPN